MPCLSCHREYSEHPNSMCYNHVHWSGYVEELEKQSYQNYGLLANEDASLRVLLEMTRDELVKEWAHYLVVNMTYISTVYLITPMRDGRGLPEEEKDFLLKEATALATKLKVVKDEVAKKATEERLRKQEEENDKVSRDMYEALKKKYESEI